MDTILLPGGRIGRGLWWIGTLLMAGVSWVAGRALYGIFGDALFSGTPGRLVLFATMAVLIWATGAVAAMRFRDRDLDPGPRVLPVIALNLLKALLDVLGITGTPYAEGVLDTLFNLAFIAIGLWFIVALGLMRGTEGPNQFGEDPRRLAVQGSFPDGPDDRGRAG